MNDEIRIGNKSDAIELIKELITQTKKRYMWPLGALVISGLEALKNALERDVI